MSQLYDVDQFVPAPSPELLCAICQNVLFHPVECPCRHVFCRSCIHTWLAEMSSCPTCRETVTAESLRSVVPLLQNLLNGLQLRCTNQGCKGLQSLECYDTHVKDCAFRTLPCPHKGCSLMLLCKELEPHSAMCDHRLIKCSNWCGLDYTLLEQSTHNCKTAVLGVLNDIKQQNKELTKVADDLRSYNVELERELASVKAQLESSNQSTSHSEEEDEIANSSSIGTPLMLSGSELEPSSDSLGDDPDPPSHLDILQQSLTYSDSNHAVSPSSWDSAKEKSSSDSEVELLHASSSSSSSSFLSSSSGPSKCILESSDEDVTEIMVRQSSLWLQLDGEQKSASPWRKRRKRDLSDGSSDSPVVKRSKKTKPPKCESPVSSSSTCGELSRDEASEISSAGE